MRGEAIHLELRQAGEEARLVAQDRSRVVVGMAALPVRKDDHLRPGLADRARDLQAVLPGVLHAAVRDVERAAPPDAQDARRLFRLARTVLGSAARAQLALGEVEDAGAMAALRHLEQGAAAGLLHVVTVSGDGEDVQVHTCGSASVEKPETRNQKLFFPLHQEPRQCLQRLGARAE